MQPWDDRRKFGKSNRALLITSKAHYLFAKDIIKEGSVLDVGAGFCTLKEYLPNTVTYIPIDATTWVCEAGFASKMDVMDCETAADYVCAFGVLETAPDIELLVEKLKSLTKVELLTSYLSSTNNDEFKSYTDEQMMELFTNCEVKILKDGSRLLRWKCSV